MQKILNDLICRGPLTCSKQVQNPADLGSASNIDAHEMNLRAGGVTGTYR